MAKSKRKRRKTQPRPEFFEAIPAASLPPLALPQISDQLESILSLLAIKLRPMSISFLLHLARAGLATFHKMSDVSRQAVMAGHYAADATGIYGPAIANDFGRFAGRTARQFTGRRARAIYLTVAAGAAFAGIVFIGSASTATIRAYANDISSPAAILAKKKTGTTILAANGEVLFQGYGAQSTKVTPLSQVPASLKNATLAAEDPAFYQHPGFSWRGTARAAITDITHQSRKEGGSTLTQQLVKNALLTQDKNFTRKFKEILLATEIERHYTKDQILEMYLNETYYGQGSHGVEAASQTLFHKRTKDLSLGESALLAGLPLGPSRFDPYVDVDSATGRRNFVLARMTDLKMITPAQADAAKAQPIVLENTPQPNPSAMRVYSKKIVIKAPHFVFYVLDELIDKYGSDVVENGGITVKSTLDLSKQQLAEQTVSTQISKLREHHVTNGGLVSIEPKTGYIMAMVGSVDYYAPGFGNVNVTLSDLQPGSSFKPIAYATAFKKGWTGATVIQDTPFSAPAGNGTMYTPQNYDLKFHGNVTARHALDNSLNIPAVKTLQFAGVPDTIQTAHDLGITTLSNPNSYGLALVLGGGEVRPIDMATVYSTFANNGTKIEPRGIVSVHDRYGKDITKPSDKHPQEVLDPRIAYMITNILTDDKSRQPEFPANGPLTLPGRPAAAKTGTTNDFRDNWTVGYTPQLATAVWVGNNDHTPMSNIDGITGAAPIWHEYMTGALAHSKVIDFTVPPGLTGAQVCADGGLANPGDAGAKTEIFMSEHMPTKRCAVAAPKPFQMPTATPGFDPEKDKPRGRDKQEQLPQGEPAPTDFPDETPTRIPKNPFD